MINELNLYEPVGRRGNSRVVRVLAELDNRTKVDIYRTQCAAEVQAARADAVAAVAQRAMQGAAFVSQIEQQLGQAVPIAVSRLQAIGDLAALSMGQVVTDTVTRGGRSCSR